MVQKLEIGDIVMCTIEKIEGTVVFASIDGNGTGSIVLSEVAPGRIRNLRDYVVPKKRVVCKVLRISGNHIDLSLRRVTQKEQKEIRERYKLEKSYKNIIKTNIKNKGDEVIKEIEKDQTIYDFVEESKINPKILEKLVGKKDCEKILEIIKNQKKRKLEIKKEFGLKSNKSEGINIIKKILDKFKEVKINYISAGKYTIKIETDDPKKGDNKIREILENIEIDAKKQGAEFSIKEK